MIIGHIGVRAGSKGLPHKNMRNLLGKPLLQWSLEHLCQHPMIEHVVVSTDCPIMYDFALKFNTLDIGLRDADLATNSCSKWLVWQDSLQKVTSLLPRTPSIFVDLDATAPLRLPEDITGMIALFQQQKPDIVLSCSDARKNPYFNLIEPDETGALQISKPLSNTIVCRQSAPAVYEHGSIYAIDPNYIRRANFLYDGRAIPYMVPPTHNHDIDNIDDFNYISWLLQQRIDNADQ